MSTVEERIEILKAENQRLEHYLHTLSPEDWHHPSTCDQWTVADVIAHLTVGNRYYAIEDVCTHDNGPLAEGYLEGTTIECPRHGARFDITTGKVLSMPAVKNVPRYEVQINGDEIQILI